MMLPQKAVQTPGRERSWPSAGHGKYERAALRWLERYLMEGSPRLQRFAEVAVDLANAPHH